MKVNGKDYVLPEFTFRDIRQLEELGVNVFTMFREPFNTLVAVLTLLNNGDEILAHNDIERHVLDGHSIAPLVDEVFDKMNQSGFMKAMLSSLNKKEETPVVAPQVKKTTTTKK